MHPNELRLFCFKSILIQARVLQVSIGDLVFTSHVCQIFSKDK